MSLQFLKNLPSEFEPLRAWLETHVESYISIQAEKVGKLRSDATGDPLSVWQSKIGGHPYFPKNCQYPQDQQLEKCMPLLLQIDCSEVPPIDGFDFPQTGILQFYLGFKPSDRKYSVLYFADITRDRNELLQEFQFIENRATIREIYDDVYQLHFSVKYDFFPAIVPYKKNIKIPENLIELYRDFEDWLFDYRGIQMRGSKMAGFPDFYGEADTILEKTQGRLLLELNYPDRNDRFLFFIKDSDLKSRHFGAVEFFFESYER
jgi:uncharacterized protein YwqG